MKKILLLVLMAGVCNLAFSSPGDSVGMTGFECQRHYSFGQRIYVDVLHQAHICWMKTPYPYSGPQYRRIEWNFRYANGNYFGEVDASPNNSGYATLDVTRDSNPAMQRTVLSWHFNTGTNAYYPFMDIDAGNGYGAWPNDPRTPACNNYLWPSVARINNGNTIMATFDYSNQRFHHLFVTTDDGITWTNPANYDSATIHTYFVRSSNNPGSNKAVIVNTKYITDSIVLGWLDMDVYYLLSTNGGVAWGPRINITHYDPYPMDSVRAAGVNAVFDLNDNLHIAWTGRHVDDGHYYGASKIFHWDEVSNTISVVSGPNPLFPGGWWGWTNPHGYGAYRLPADEPQLVVDRTTGWLYCIWHGQDDTTDYSAAGYSNGDFYGSYSTDGGLTWGAYGSSHGYVNLTNTHTPGGLPGQCEDEDFMTANPFTVSDSIYITYIEDKDAGIINASEGDTTNNIVRVWVFHKSLISGPTAVEENKASASYRLRMDISPNPVSGQIEISFTYPHSDKVSLKLYSADGRFVKEIYAGLNKAGTHVVNTSIRDLANGSYYIILSDGKTEIKRSIIVVH